MSKKNRLLAKKGLTTYIIYCIMRAESSKERDIERDIGGLRND